MLSKDEIKVLNLLYHSPLSGPELEKHSVLFPAFKSLKSKGLIKLNNIDAFLFAAEITQSGKAELETYQQERKDIKIKVRLDIIALVIASIAMLVSIISLFK